VNYFYYHPYFRVAGGYPDTANNPFVLGKSISGANNYVYDKDKDIIHIGNTQRHGPKFDSLNQDNTKSSFVWHSDLSPHNPSQGLSPWDFIIFSPTSSSIPSGVYRYTATGDPVITNHSSQLITSVTPISTEATRFSNTTYGASGMSANPPDDRGGSINVTLSHDGEITYSGFYDESTGSYSYGGAQYFSGHYSTSIFDVNDSESDAFYTLGGLQCEVDPSTLTLI